jgi:hypothetical protein
MTTERKWYTAVVMQVLASLAGVFLSMVATFVANEPSKRGLALTVITVTLVLLLITAYSTFRYLKIKIQARMNDEERAEAERLREIAKEDEALYRAIEQEARYLVKEIPKHLSVQNKLDYRPTYDEHRGKKGRRKKRTVEFDAILITRTEIWFHFNGRKLPYGVSFSDIRDPQHRVRENLQYAIHRPCRFYEDYEYNLFLRVGLKNSVMGVPKNVKWARIFPALPKSNSFAFGVGVSEYGKLIYQDIRSWPHGIVAGSTGMGKTIMLTQIIVTMALRNNPEMCKFIFVDLKDGVEFYKFRDLPHTLAFIEDPDGVQEQLDWLAAQYKRRMAMFKGVCRDIKGWNAQKAKKLPYIFMFIDELAIVTLDKKFGASAIDTMIPLVQRARAAGIHLIVATQVLQAEVLPMLLRANFDGRIVFSVPGNSESIVVLGNGMAVGLEVEGRMVFKNKKGYQTLQGPMITEKEVNEAIERIMSGEKPEDAPFDELDLFRVAVNNLGGLAGWRELYDSVDGAMGQRKIQSVLKAYEYDFSDPAGSVIDLDGDRYILAPSVLTSTGKSPRRLLSVNGRLPETDDDLQDLIMSQVASSDESTDNTPSEAENIIELEE